MFSIDAILKQYSAVDYKPQFVAPKVVVEKVKSEVSVPDSKPPLHKSKTVKRIHKRKKKRLPPLAPKAPQQRMRNKRTAVSVYRRNLSRIPKSMPIKFSAKKKYERRQKEINFIVAMIDDKTIRKKLIEMGTIEKHSTAPPEILRHIYKNIRLSNATIKKQSST